MPVEPNIALNVGQGVPPPANPLSLIGQFAAARNALDSNAAINAHVEATRQGIAQSASDNIARIYEGRTGRPAAHWRERMRAETWYDDHEAVAPGEQRAEPVRKSLGQHRDRPVGEVDARAARAGDLDPHLPRSLRPDPAPRGAAPRLPVELHDLRPGRPGPARQAVP